MDQIVLDLESSDEEGGDENFEDNDIDKAFKRL